MVRANKYLDKVKTKTALTLTHVQTVGSKGAGELQFHTPWSVCETISGYIAVADIHNDCGDCGAGRGGPVGAGAGAGRGGARGQGGATATATATVTDCDSSCDCGVGSDGHWGGPGSDDGDRTAAVAAAAAACGHWGGGGGSGCSGATATPTPTPTPTSTATAAAAAAAGRGGSVHLASGFIIHYHNQNHTAYAYHIIPIQRRKHVVVWQHQSTAIPNPPTKKAGWV